LTLAGTGLSAFLEKLKIYLCGRLLIYSRRAILFQFCLPGPLFFKGILFSIIVWKSGGKELY
jgi:hypothetical protein